MSRLIYYTKVKPGKKNVSSYGSAMSVASQTAFSSIRSTIAGAVYSASDAARECGFFIIYFLPLFSASILTPGFLPGGKDKRCGNVPSLPAAASRFVICAESGKKTIAGSEGNGARAVTLTIPRQSIPAPMGLGILPNLKNGVCMYEQN